MNLRLSALFIPVDLPLKYSWGLFQVAANPTGAVGSLAYICQACATWNVSCMQFSLNQPVSDSLSIQSNSALFVCIQEIKSEGLQNEVCQILNGYKQVKFGLAVRLLCDARIKVMLLF
jgi:hypothetical protein